jgi:hypothetical protein
MVKIILKVEGKLEHGKNPPKNHHAFCEDR